MPNSSPHDVVVVGGGAGGLELATQLGESLGKSGRARITLVDRSRTHIWKPLLHSFATGDLRLYEAGLHGRLFRTLLGLVVPGVRPAPTVKLH
jgi:NADH dehydrogenase